MFQVANVFSANIWLIIHVSPAPTNNFYYVNFLVICICHVLSNQIAQDMSCIINTKDCMRQYSAVGLLRTDVH